MVTAIQDTPITGNGDGQSGSTGSCWDSWAEFRAAYDLQDQQRAARQLRNAVRRVVALHAKREPDLYAVGVAAVHDVDRFVHHAVDELIARDRFRQLELQL